MKLLSLASRFAPELLCFERPAENRNRIALTFDDGPHPEHTPRILDILARQEVRATFFFQGVNAARWPMLVRSPNRGAWNRPRRYLYARP